MTDLFSNPSTPTFFVRFWKDEKGSLIKMYPFGAHIDHTTKTQLRSALKDRFENTTKPQNKPTYADIVTSNAEVVFACQYRGEARGVIDLPITRDH